MSRPLRVAMVEPHGSGGICQYTYQLCSALAAAGVEVTVFTGDKYELRDRPHDHKVESFASSRLKALLARNSAGAGASLLRPATQVRPAQNAGARSRVSTGTGTGTDADTNTKPVSETKTHPDSSRSQTDTRTQQERHPARHATPSRSNTLRSNLRTLYLQTELLVRVAAAGTRVLHIQFLWPIKAPVLFLIIAKLLRIRVVHTAHNLLPHDEHSAKALRAKKVWYRLVSHIIVHSKSNRSELHELFSVPTRNVSVIPHGNYAFFADANATTQADRPSRLCFDDDDVVLLFFGAIRKYKGLDLLLDAFRDALVVNANLRLVIAGKFSTYDGKDADYFAQHLETLGIKHAVHFAPGYVAMSDVPAYFNAADVVVLPYLKTYESGVAHLAFAHGRPVVATDTGGLAELVEDGVTGRLVPRNQRGPLVQAVVELANDPALRREMGQRAQRRSRDDYSWHAIAQKTMQVYESLTR